MALFSAEELEELKRADAEIDAEYRLTNDELRESRARDRAAELEAMEPEKRKKAEYRRAYREANREKVLEAKRAYYEANREKVREYQHAYYEANREKVLEYQRAYYEANREKVREYKQARYEANREEICTYMCCRRKIRKQQKSAEAEALREWMQETGTTQTALAEKIGVSQPTISSWASGATRPKLEIIRARMPALARELEEPVQNIFGEKYSKRRSTHESELLQDDHAAGGGKEAAQQRDEHHGRDAAQETTK